MDSYGTARLAAKDAESAIVARIREEFNLTPVLARAHYEQRAQYFTEYGQMAASPGELCYLAVDAEEPPGKAISSCRKIQVRLELAAAEDLEVLRAKGLGAMRERRLARLCRQARVQGGLLTVEDLAYLTCSSPATVKRDLAALRRRDEAAPTRGQIRDIGPGVTHKARVVQLYLWGLQFTEIEQRTAHSEGSIRRYLADFRQIAALYARGAKVPEIRAATGRSAGLIAEYIGLYERARREFPAAPRLYDLLDVQRGRAQRGGVGEGGAPLRGGLPPPGPAQPGLPAAVQVPARVRLRPGSGGGRGHRGRHLRHGPAVLRPARGSRAGAAHLPRAGGHRAGRPGQDHGQDEAGPGPAEHRGGGRHRGHPGPPAGGRPPGDPGPEAHRRGLRPGRPAVPGRRRDPHGVLPGRREPHRGGPAGAGGVPAPAGLRGRHGELPHPQGRG